MEDQRRQTYGSGRLQENIVFFRVSIVEESEISCSRRSQAGFK